MCISFSSSCPLTRELAPILEHRVDCPVSWSFTGGRTPCTGDQLVARPLPKNRKTNTETFGHTLHIHAQGWNLTRNHGLRAIEDFGYHDRCRVYKWPINPITNQNPLYSQTLSRDNKNRKNTSCPFRESNLDSSTAQPVAYYSLYRLSYPGSTFPVSLKAAYIFRNFNNQRVVCK
jgi:hypothetical protein